MLTLDFSQIKAVLVKGSVLNAVADVLIIPHYNTFQPESTVERNITKYIGVDAIKTLEKVAKLQLQAGS